MELSKIYEPKKVENKIYKFWQESGFFNPDKLPKRHKKPYCIVIPPPNITGELHIGHALNAVVQDVLIRWRRMQGYKTLWLPGTDHAGIATQNVVEKILKKEGKTRFDLGRAKFIERIWEWKEKYGNIILDQLKKMGASLDWSRTRFTMDKNYTLAVQTAFLHYFKKGWIYRGKRVINWCPRCQTSLSDLELEYKEEKGKLWYIRYPLTKKSIVDTYDNFIVVATTRPETMLGDTAVAVNPKDERYKNLVGKKVILPLVGREIPIIADSVVDPKFGTGAVKITPAHDLTDYEIGLDHNLESIQVIGEKGEITKEAPVLYQGLKIIEARQKIVQDLEKLRLLDKVEDHPHQIPKCYRCQTTCELIPSWQWFLKMEELAKMAKIAVREGKISFIPKRWEKVYFDWLKNIKDWCVSRQLWWGHRIPLSGETDVLDTWFSSALWPFATFGWPQETKDLKIFYPTDVLSTDRGIINLWVTRMIFSGMEFIKKVPFGKVYIHPTVLTKEGQRMSKSLGTGVDPVNLIEKYGADATRFGVIYQITELQDIKFTEDNIVMGRKFCNKLWNASRFVLMNKPAQIYADLGQLPSQRGFTRIKNLTLADKKILKTLDKIIKSVNKDLENFRFGKAAHTIYDFFWHDFCDKYLEEFKGQKSKLKSQKVLLYVLLTSIKLLHPFIPFITEEIYQKLPLQKCLMIEQWPK
ncbi:MAG: valine--tRNA ligase [Candidatus Nealsonbacteria bacterium CG_4_10_14_0_8_um_filter_37_14]|uniref:Valine--tRNA ligase n=1 Tax=Candidatus Nealsonbacteria bacterium CG_4_10_14_0_8_um_filter_37_14 TaxID=1974684 RepID=A0A2M7R771_9BACT|nr:MAG: valine--tRNA ligase [Candidatus Nealsonbacteria bacterium CG_4_10_14_0_8_um_filter_37_14]